MIAENISSVWKIFVAVMYMHLDIEETQDEKRKETFLKHWKVNYGIKLLFHIFLCI